LFADTKGSTELIRDLDPEAAQRLLDPAIHRMMDAVHRYEGTVNQMLGDGIMALFGAPIAHEDHALRACYAALAMQAAMRDYTEEIRRTHGLEVRIRVGLNSGEVVVRAIGSDLHMDYTAVGQTTHLAARMEQMATPGSVLMTAHTLRLVEGLVQVTPLGPVTVKGMADAVDVCELLGAGPARTRLQASAARELTPFVGRHTELQALREALAQAGAGRGQLVAVIGEPGVGKSRLLAEFLASPRTQGWRILETTAVSYGQTTPYLPIRHLLQAFFQLADRVDEPAVRENVDTCLTRDAALQPTRSAVLTLLDVRVEDPEWQALDPAQRRLRTIDSVRRLLLRQSQGQPLLVSVEDLHWTDAETQAVLDSLIESLPTARLLLLVTYRPEYQHTWGSKTYYTQLRLDPLPPEGADELLQALMGDNRGLMPLKRLLIERTEGNPFFLEESVQTLVETQVLRGERGAYHLAHGRPTLQVPATVQAVLAARIDRLPPAEKRLLQTAAVIGTEVPFGLLQAIAEASEEALHVGLTHLRRAEFLYETHLFPELVYTFKHALTHEVAYGSLLQARRRTLHARLVEALEGGYPARLAEPVDRLAHHAVRGEVWEKAATYSQRVGDKACARGALREAAAGYEQALDALGHLPETADTGELAVELRRRFAGVLSLRGEYPRSLALLSEAEARARQLDDRARLGQVLATMAFVRRELGDLDGAMAAGRQALELDAWRGHPALQTDIFSGKRLGPVYVSQVGFGRAAKWLRRDVEALAPGGPGPVRPWEILARAWLAWVLAALGEFAEGRRHGEEALRLVIVEGRREALTIAHGCLGLLYLEQGDWDAAVRVLERGLALGRASGPRDWLPNIAGPLGEAYARVGRLAESLALMEEALRVGTPTGALVAHTAHVTHLSAVELLAGRLDEAWQQACQAIDLARQRQARWQEARALFQLGAVHAHASPSDMARAEVRYREALTLAEALGMRPLAAHCHLGLGSLSLRIGRRQEARAELSTAIELYRAMDMTFWLPQAEAELAEAEGC
jgi:class 3 adenylate cyclase/tetratricopeptide (TPR) repeat protein